MDLKVRKKYQNQPKEYKCENCGKKIKAPMHCGHPMYIEKAEGKKMWTCWMGPECGEQEVEACCDAPSLVPL